MASRTFTVDRSMFRLRGQNNFWDRLSISDKHLSVNQTQSRPFGQDGDIAWDIAGPALRHWESEVLPIADTICQRDKREIFARIDWAGKFELISYMIGRTWDTSKPTLVIRIYDIGVIGRFGSRLRKEERFRKTGFFVMGQKGDLVFKAAPQMRIVGEDPYLIRQDTIREDPQLTRQHTIRKEISPSRQDSLSTQSVSSGSEHEYHSKAAPQSQIPRSTLFGATILICPDNAEPDELVDTPGVDSSDTSSSERIATLGAIVKIGERIFALTAAHSLSEPLPQTTSQGASAEVVDPRQNETFDEGFFDLFDDDDNPKISEETFERKTNDLQAVFDLNTPRSIFSVSIRNPSSDALISKPFDRGPKLAHFSGWLTVSKSPNTVAEQHANPDLDWALLTLDHEETLDPVNRIRTEKSTITTLVPSTGSPRGEVLVVSKASQYRRAYCSGVIALISIPGSDGLRRVYTISSRSSVAGSAPDLLAGRGESGSLVIDAESGDAHGLIVAESNNLNYMIPIQDIFDDISKKWNGDSVTFPSEKPKSILPIIPKDDIRLFVLEPGSSADAIRGTLVSSRPELGEYDFFSYSWETQFMSQPITVNGEIRHVPQSLEDMLRCLRQEDRPRTLWVDAICMNMDDLAERGRTIPQYPRIAAGATQVCIWLGKESNDTEDAFELIDQIPDLISDKEHDRPFNFVRDEGDYRLVALISLLKRPWFSRRWVVQEVSFARTASIHCGRFQAEWAQFASSLSLLASVWRDVGPLPDISRFAATRLAILSGCLFEMPLDIQSVKPLLPLDSLVCLLADFKTSFPQDAVYALLAVAKSKRWPVYTWLDPLADEMPTELSVRLAEHVAIVMRIRVARKRHRDRHPVRKPGDLGIRAWVLNDPENRVADRIADRSMLYWRLFLNRLRLLVLRRKARRKANIKDEPIARHSSQRTLGTGTDTQLLSRSRLDYRQSFLAVASNLVLFTAFQGGSIDIICRAWAPSSEEAKLPSWIRSLKHAEYVTSPAGDPTRLNAEPLTSLRGLDLPRYRAGPRLENQPAMDSKSLTVEGFVLGRVSVLEPSALLGNIPREWLEIGGWRVSDGVVHPELWRTLVADRDINGQHAPLWYGLACKYGIQSSIEGGDLNTTDLLTRVLPARFAEFWKRVQRVVWSRRLIYTDTGNPGLAPKATRYRDLVCVLRGCSVPVILRENSLSDVDFRNVDVRKTIDCALVGECFIYGMMDGEALELDLPQREFVLS